MRYPHNVLVTGGAGFIGSHFIRYLLRAANGFSGRVVNFDALTYAGNLENIADIANEFGENRYVFIRGDICDEDTVQTIFKTYDIDCVVHCAAESHVDRSIAYPEAFARTNVMGTYALLETAKRCWLKNVSARTDVLFHHVSTDEVYGPVEGELCCTEKSRYNPRSPYSASKAASDHFVKAYFHTYGLPVTVSNCCNNFGPFQLTEKFIPRMITNMLAGAALPVYGDGRQVRDWLYVEDHCRALWAIIQSGQQGETYNIGGENKWENICLLHKLIEIVCAKANLNIEKTRETIMHIIDRPGHDGKYNLDCSKLKHHIGWKPISDFTEALHKTVAWYIANNNNA